MEKGKLAARILVGLGLIGLVWKFSLEPQLKYNRKLSELKNADSLIECTGTIWAAYKKYAPKWIRWEDYKRIVVELNNIKDEDFPGPRFKVPYVEK
ncbi:MAG: hypothetical protein N3G19_02440 [Candidatus Pacearchaeota archaeon]|nr:hypothetical protein [Candidatus Pacearchaeota archaeon]